MDKTIFYSWQSNLPNKDNRNYIESCLKKAIKSVNKNILIDYSLDKDTFNEFGSPDIPNTILQKIDNSIYFVADISITENGSPNPNVLLELGYAIAKLGWERVVCIFNLKYGDVEKLPFDLKFHRILTYNSDVPNDKTKIANIISRTIQNKDTIVDSLLNNDILSKQRLDKHLIYILNSFCSIYGYEKYQFSQFANNIDELADNLKRRKMLGFYLFKKMDDVLSDLEDLNNSIDSFFSRRNVKSTISSLIISIKSFEHFCSERQNPNLFIDTHQKDINYKVIHGSELNKENKDEYILFKKHDIGQYMVVDFGNLHSLTQVNLSTNYIIINELYIDSYVEHTIKVISVIMTYLKQFNDYFDIDLLKEFDVKKSNSLERQVSHQNGVLSTSSKKVLDLNTIKQISYDKIIHYNFFFNLIKVGVLFDKQEDIKFNIETFFQNEFNLQNDTIEPTNLEIISKEEYDILKKGGIYSISEVIIPNSVIDFIEIIEEDNNTLNDKYMSNMYTNLKYNLFELIPALIQETISSNFKHYIQKDNDIYANLHDINVSFYSDYKSINEK